MLAVMVAVVVAGVVTHRANNGLYGKSVYVLHAGSLILTMEDLGSDFETGRGFHVMTEGHGSIQASNMIRDGQRNPEVFLSASVSAVEVLVDDNKADWYITFATDELVIAYTDDNPQKKKLDMASSGMYPWYEVLIEEDLRLGRTDPELDPKGYRGIIMAQLAEDFYNVTGLRNDLLGSDRNPEQVFPEETLMTQLEMGQLGVIIAYRHEAIERGLSFIELPPEINLGSDEFEDVYSQALYKTDSGHRRYGTTIEFTLTIPKKVGNQRGAVEFCDYLLSDDGATLLREHGFNNKQEYDVGGDFTKVPPGLQSYLD